MIDNEAFRRLVLEQKEDKDIFIETGTRYGDTSLWASKYFRTVISIEIDEICYAYSVKKLKDNTNILLLFGDSSKLLGEVLANLKEDAVFLLDAHPVDGKTLDGNPLLEEMEHIMGSNYNHIIYIDDVRLFGLESFPELEKILEIINKYNYNYSYAGDIMVCKR